MKYTQHCVIWILIQYCVIAIVLFYFSYFSKILSGVETKSLVPFSWFNTNIKNEYFESYTQIWPYCTFTFGMYKASGDNFNY